MLFIFYLFISSIFFHPIYISVLEINSSDDDLEVVIKIFRDDLEDGVRGNLNSQVSIDTQDKIGLNKHFIEKYINNVLKIYVNDEKKTISFSEFLLENDRIKISGKILNNSRITSLNIENNILIDIFTLQSNIVFAKIYDKIFNINLDKSKKSEKLIVE